MNVSQMESSSFSCFNSLDKRKKSACVNAVRYICKLAALSTTDISNWEIDKVFKHPENEGEIIINKNTINQVFFAYREQAPEVVTNVSPEWVTKLNALEKKRQAHSASHLKDRAVNFERSAIEHYRRYFKSIQDAAKCRKQYQILLGYKPNYLSEVSDISKAGFWDLYGVSDSAIEFVTKNEVHLTYVHEKHGVLKTVNMGKFRMIYSPVTSSILVVQHSNNITFDGLYHPHIDTVGHVCFGELNATAMEWLSSGNITRVCEIVQAAITAYNDGSPYRSIISFFRARVAKDNRIHVSRVNDSGEFDNKFLGEVPDTENTRWVELVHVNGEDVELEALLDEAFTVNTTITHQVATAAEARVILPVEISANEGALDEVNF